MVSSGTLSFTTAPPPGSGNGTSDVTITDTLANLNKDIASLVYTNTKTNVLSDQLKVTIDDLGHNGTVVDPTNPNATSLTATQSITIPFNAVANVALGTPSVVGDQPSNPTGDLLARHPLTYTFPVTDNGPSDASNVAFSATYMLQNQTMGIGFGTVSVSYSDGMTRPFLMTTTSNVLNVTLASLPNGVIASIMFTVTGGEAGTLAYSDTLSDGQIETNPPSSPSRTLMGSSTLQDAGIVSFAPSDTSLDEKVGIPGSVTQLPPIIDTDTFTDYPITVQRTVATGPASLGVDGAPATHDTVTFSLNLSGNAEFGTLGNNADYAIVVLNDPTKPNDAASANPTNETVYDGSNNQAIKVTIPAGLSSVQIYIRVYKSFHIIPEPDVVADLTLVPLPGAAWLPHSTRRTSRPSRTRRPP